jgi:hypothetical protein
MSDRSIGEAGRMRGQRRSNSRVSQHLISRVISQAKQGSNQPHSPSVIIIAASSTFPLAS